MNNKISDKDKKDWQDFLKKKERLTDKDNNFLQNNRIKSKTIDLHGYTLDSANKTIDEFIRKSFEENVEKITVITGKGLHSTNDKDIYVSKDLGKLKYSVPEFIKTHPECRVVFTPKDYTTLSTSLKETTSLPIPSSKD